MGLFCAKASEEEDVRFARELEVAAAVLHSVGEVAQLDKYINNGCSDACMQIYHGFNSLSVQLMRRTKGSKE